jgi:hypothetical protein
MTPCTITENYSDRSGQATWAGSSIAADPDFRAFISGPVCERLEDAEEGQAFAAELTGLAGTGVAVETVEAVLTADDYERQPWEVGEAMAEVLLAEHRGAIWPWNTERDKRTPKASLPGADLIGFVTLDDGEASLAIGEVKTSADEDRPPGVVNGRGGMAHQLERLERDRALQVTILKWLRPRCDGTDYWPLYESAVRRFLNSRGRDFILFGLLMRDTIPHALDLEARGKALGAVDAPTAYELSAWYLPHPIAEWPQLAAGATQ